MKLEKIFSYIFRNLNIFKKYIKNYREKRYLDHIFQNSKRTDKLNGKEFVFNTVKNVKGYIHREMFLGKILALNGAKVKILFDNGLLKHWESGFDNKRYQNPIYTFFNKQTIKKPYKFYKDPNLEIIYYQDIINKKKLSFKNLESLKKHAISSTIRFFRTSALDYKKKEVSNFYNCSLYNCVVSRAVGQYILDNIRPDYFITSHGIYSVWGPCYDILKKEDNIEAFLYARFHSHSNDPQDMYFTTAKAQTLTRCKLWKKYKETPVTQEMRKKVDDLFKSRIGHNTKDTNLYYRDEVKSFTINEDENYKYHIAIFPNLIWDGNIQERHLAFDGILDWLTSTIDFLKDRKDVKIFLKFHPAEVTTFRDSAKIQDLIKDYLEKNDIYNLVLIPTEKKIDPYEFLKSGIDLGICYDGMLGLEMVYLKIPVLMGGVRGRFTVEGGNYTINSREEYFKNLENLGGLIEDFHKNFEHYYEKIVRYTYWYIFENVIKCPIISNKGYRKINVFQLTKDDIQLDEKILEIFG